MFVPLTLAAFGIVLRGASFAFREAVFRTRLQRHFGAIFAVSPSMSPARHLARDGIRELVPARAGARRPRDYWLEDRR
jgi:cytochrome bd ubiquinol oxidase subunit II